jgi:hypothetical protein
MKQPAFLGTGRERRLHKMRVSIAEKVDGKSSVLCETWDYDLHALSVACTDWRLRQNECIFVGTLPQRILLTKKEPCQEKL